VFNKNREALLGALRLPQSQQNAPFWMARRMASFLCQIGRVELCAERWSISASATIDQTTANQERELREIAGRTGCEIVNVYKDHSISGAKGRDRRPAFDKTPRAGRGTLRAVRQDPA
jgi:hypothetical protein